MVYVSKDGKLVRAPGTILAGDPAKYRQGAVFPAPDRCVVDIETTLLQQLLNIAQRKRIAKIPPDRTEVG